MATKMLIFASMALLVCGMSSANAGPCANKIESLTKRLSATDAGSGPTGGGTRQTQAPADSSGQHPPTAVMSQETQGKAISSEDVRRQNQGQPTAAQQAAIGMTAGGDEIDQAGNALQRARALDGQAKEAACMEAVQEVEQLAGAPQ